MFDICHTIPHRYPFLMLDKITEVEQGKWAKGYKLVTNNEWFITEVNSKMPSTMIIEALAQLGAFATTSNAGGLGFLSSLGGVTCLGNAYAGDRVDLFYEIEKIRKGFVVGKGEARVNGELIVQAEEIIIYLQS